MQADPVLLVIESGFLIASAQTDFEPAFSLTAPDFSITGGAATPASFKRAGGVEGSPYDLSSSVRLSSDPRSCRLCHVIGNNAPFELRFRGQTYRQETRPGAPPPPLYTGLFEFASFLRHATPTQNTTPFVFRGNLTGENLNLTLFGSGTVTAEFTRALSSLDWRGIRYEFHA